MKTTSNDTAGENRLVQCVKSLFGKSSSRSKTPETPAAVVAKPNATANRKILIVDDDAVFVKATSMKLQREGFAVITASDGAGAIQAMRQEKPHLVLLDLNFPSDVNMVSWDGFSIMSWLLRFEEARKVPIIVVSAGGSVGNVKRALTSGARAFFHKSSDPGNLISVIRLMLAEKFLPSQRIAPANFQI